MTDAVIAQQGPHEIELKGTYRYAWRACGRSNYQPFRDGSHRKLDGRPLPGGARDRGDRRINRATPASCGNRAAVRYFDG